MLKTKLIKACFLFSGFMCMALASGSKSIIKDTAIYEPVIIKSEGHQFDSSGLCSCMSFIESDDVKNSYRLQLNKNVSTFVKDYTRKNGYFLQKSKKRVDPYFRIIDSVFDECGIPVELKYLAYIESGLKCHTASRSGAIGPWAFMPIPAREYGLKIYGKRDERLDYYKSSSAAALLLNDLYAKYGDWLLVIAAYNCGPGNVQKAIKRSGSRNYWSLQNFLPLETRMHVKKFIAVHYFFEGHGSLVTMTKSETEKHIKCANEFVATSKSDTK